MKQTPEEVKGRSRLQSAVEAATPTISGQQHEHRPEDRSFFRRKERKNIIAVPTVRNQYRSI
jgi:hypothetical protein